MKTDTTKILELQNKLSYAEFGIDIVIKHCESVIDIYRKSNDDIQCLSSVLSMAVDVRERLSKMPNGEDE